jgi:hypothetical protein
MFEYPTWAAHLYVRSSSRSLLPDSIRREIAALNAQYLATVVAASDEAAPRCWRGEAMPPVGEPPLLDAMSACPFTLFELRLDEVRAPGTVALAAEESMTTSLARRPQREALAQSALTLAWRLAESSPLSLRLALGFSAAAELVMNEMRVTSLVAWAREPGLLRTRWVEHTAFWKGLFQAAERHDAALATRVHCLGITLLAGELGSRARDRVMTGCGADKCRR